MTVKRFYPAVGKQLLACLLLLPALHAGAQEYERSLLWEVKGPSLKEPSYLYGTIHIQSKAVFLFDSVVQNRLDAAEAFAMEIIPDEIPPLMDLYQTMMSDTTLDQLLSAADYHKLDTFLQARTGMTADVFNHFKPVVVLIQARGDAAPQDMDVPLDLKLLETAREKGKKTFALESFTDVLDAFNGIPLAEQAQMLIQAIDDTSDTALEMKKLQDLYLSQDINQMVNMMDEPGLPKAFKTHILINRNKKITSKLITLFQEHSTFAAFGAAHLAGPEGVLMLLEKQGYQVRPLHFSFTAE